MSKRQSGVGRRFLFRSLLLLFLGLVTVGFLLDRVLLQVAEQSSDTEQLSWVSATAVLLEQQLSRYPSSEWPAVLDGFSSEFDIGANLLGLDQLAMPGSVNQALRRGNTVPLYGAEGEAQYLRQLSLGSTDKTPMVLTLSFDDKNVSASSWHWLSYFYYFAVFCLLAWWLRPLVRDVEWLNSAAEKLGKDIHADTPELDQVTELQVLSGTFRQMADRLRAMVQGQKEMTNALSHELRTPLARAKFALAVIDQRVDDEVRDELQKIGADINEFDALVARMLDYARLDDPASHFQPQIISVQPWLEALCVKSRAETLGINVSISVDPIAAEVYADEVLLALAFSNLLSNAIRYAHSSIQIQCVGNARQWRLSVSDDGPGIPEGDMHSVFKPFKRLDESRDRDTGGHGLGLAIVARIAALHKGECVVGRSPAGGAQFQISLPQ
ncbi:MAG: ATP-binding protein [Pseudomonadales bacterium]